MNEICPVCGKEIKEGEDTTRLQNKNLFHLKCSRKVRKKAKNLFFGDLNLAIKFFEWK